MDAGEPGWFGAVRHSEHPTGTCIPIHGRFYPEHPFASAYLRPRAGLCTVNRPGVN
jgi:hypothetical protein